MRLLCLPAMVWATQAELRGGRYGICLVSLLNREESSKFNPIVISVVVRVVPCLLLTFPIQEIERRKLRKSKENLEMRKQRQLCSTACLFALVVTLVDAVATPTQTPSQTATPAKTGTKTSTLSSPCAQDCYIVDGAWWLSSLGTFPGGVTCICYPDLEVFSGNTNTSRSRRHNLPSPSHSSRLESAWWSRHTHRG